MSLHQVNVFVAGHTLVTQGASPIGFLNQDFLEEKKFHEVAITTSSRITNQSP